MKDTELNEVLKRASVPKRGEDYWARFPSQVAAEIERRRQFTRAERSMDASGTAEDDGGTTWSWAFAFRSLGAKPVFVVAVAAVCLLLGFVFGSWKGTLSPDGDSQLAEARKYFHELETLFPDQLQAIVFDQQGTHLVLAPTADVPASPPLYLRISGPEGSRRVVTFSGQQIRVNGEVCDVLVNHQGKVLVVGQETLWSDAKVAIKGGAFRIEARALEANL